MNINDLYPSKYLKSDDIGQARVTLQVAAIKLEEVAENENAKPVMHFNGKDKGMVLNKTNALMCAHVWGGDTEAWTGQWLDLFVEPKMFQGKVVNGLSVAPKLPQTAAAPDTFQNAADLARPPSQPNTDSAAPTPSTPPIDDDIPF
ncbi:MAG: hypothetical protein HKN06_05190 [Gammaproteobacteria bacterium]|nr:hypothetical protein [Gammaproteobacteria bacterium]